MHRLARVPLEAWRRPAVQHTNGGGWRCPAVQRTNVGGCVPFMHRRCFSLQATPMVHATSSVALDESRGSETSAEGVVTGSETSAEGVVTGFTNDGRAVVRLSAGLPGTTVGNSNVSRDVLVSGRLLMRGLRVQLMQHDDSGEWLAVPMPGQRRPKNKCIHPTRAGGLCRDCPRRKTGRK